MTDDGIKVWKLNKREAPKDLPTELFVQAVDHYAEQDDPLDGVYWYDESFEYLTPDELQRVKAKARVWLDVTGSLPTNTNVWWELRVARRHGRLPHSRTAAYGTINDYDGYTCGHCGARWNDRPRRCKLCDTIIIMRGGI